MEFKGNGVLKALYTYTENSSEWENAILTRKEFENFREIENLFKIEKNKNELLTIDNRNQANFIVDLKNKKLELEEKIKKLNELILEKDNQYLVLKNQNENLLRINRERSNSERNLYPKKSHNGYTILFQQNFIQSIKVRLYSKYNAKSMLKEYLLNVYKYKLETPYLSNLDINIAKEYILKDLKTFYQIDYVQDIKQENNFLENKEKKEVVFNLKISTSNKFYFIEFISNKAI